MHIVQSLLSKTMVFKGFSKVPHKMLSPLYKAVSPALLHFRTPLPFFIDDSGAEFHAD